MFPFFGPPTREEHVQSKLPQHGYARGAVWNWEGPERGGGGIVMDHAVGVGVRLSEFVIG